MHGSYGIGSDAYPVTVVEVSPSGHRVVVEQDDFHVVSGSVMDGSAEFGFTRREGGPRRVFTRRADGRYLLVGAKNYGTLSLGEWHADRDPSF
jgi:hypothetical protein